MDRFIKSGDYYMVMSFSLSLWLHFIDIFMVTKCSLFKWVFFSLMFFLFFFFTEIDLLPLCNGIGNWVFFLNYLFIIFLLLINLNVMLMHTLERNNYYYCAICNYLEMSVCLCKVSIYWLFHGVISPMHICFNCLPQAFLKFLLIFHNILSTKLFTNST